MRSLLCCDGRQTLNLSKWVKESYRLGKPLKSQGRYACGPIWAQIGTPDVKHASLEEKVLHKRFLQRGFIL